jgi:hypothetical protein
MPSDRCLDLAVIKRSLQLDIKQCRYSREEIAARLSIAVSRPITVAQINAWTAETNANRFPLDMLAAWVVVTGSRRLLDLVVQSAGFAVADEYQVALAAYAKTLLDKELANACELQQREALIAARKARAL